VQPQAGDIGCTILHLYLSRDCLMILVGAAELSSRLRIGSSAFVH